MRGRLKTIVCSLMGAVLMIGSASAVTVNGSFCGINDYLDEPDRAGATYVSKLNTELAVVFGSSYNYSGTLLKDSQVTASALKSRLNASPKTIFAFSGHGYVNGPMSYDSTIVPKEAIRTQHRYVVMYSCNWMTNNGLSSSCMNTLPLMELVCNWAMHLRCIWTAVRVICLAKIYRIRL